MTHFVSKKLCFRPNIPRSMAPCLFGVLVFTDIVKLMFCLSCKYSIFWFFFQGLRLLNNPLPKLCQNNKNLTRLIVNLFPFDCGYSLMLKTCSSQYTETIQLPYDEFELLNYIDNEQVLSVHCLVLAKYKCFSCNSIFATPPKKKKNLI